MKSYGIEIPLIDAIGITKSITNYIIEITFSPSKLDRKKSKLPNKNTQAGNYFNRRSPSQIKVLGRFQAGVQFLRAGKTQAIF